MTLTDPVCITSRLMPGVRVPGHGSLSEISIAFDDWTSDGRIRYRYHIDTPTFEHVGSDLKSGVGGGTLQSGLESLLAFLCAAAEAYPDGENADLFPPNVTEWAHQHSDELSMLQCELEERPNAIMGDEAHT